VLLEERAAFALPRFPLADVSTETERMKAKKKEEDERYPCGPGETHLIRSATPRENLQRSSSSSEANPVNFVA